MPIFKDYGEKGELLQEQYEGLNTDNLPKYADQNSIDRVRGYVDCLEDITTQFKEFLEIHGSKTWCYNTAHMIKKGTIKLYEEKELFLEFAKNFIEKISSNKDAGEKPAPLS
jgi:hypothetical protein